MKIVFMGTPDFAVATLEALVAAGHELLLVLTQPDKPRGRHGEKQKSAVRICAEKYGIPVLTPVRLRLDEVAKSLLRELAPELIVVTAYGQILPKDVLDIPKHGCINVHASLLPKYRGASPIQWAILNGDDMAGVTTMLMGEGLDDGDILEQAELRLSDKETGGSLFEKLSLLGGELIVHTIELLNEGKLKRTPQDESLVSKVGMFKKDSGRIDWSRSAVDIERMIRGLNPWPSAFSYLNGKQLKLWDADPLEMDSISLDNMCNMGELDGQGKLYTDGRRLIVLCGDGLLAVNELQLEGKKRMRTEDFLRGYKP